MLVLASAVAAQEKTPVADLSVEYGKVLSAYVDDDGMVYYLGLKQNPKDLGTFLLRIGAVKRRDFDRWTDPQKIAFWINAYNGITLKSIIDSYPITKSGWFSRFPANSIRQISGVWNKTTWDVMGRPMTLDAIEHEELRKHFNEPRIHMALVCAAIGCPRLRNEPYTGATLDAQLKDQSEWFVRHREKFRIDTRAKTVHMSAIFEWFGGDFVKTWGKAPELSGRGDNERATLHFALQHLPADKRPRVTKDFGVKYLSYDWSLNERTKPVR